MGVAHLAERLARLEHLADRLGMRNAHHLAVPRRDEGQLADLFIDLLEDRLQFFGGLEMLTSQGAILALRALVVPLGLGEVDGVVRLFLHEFLLLLGVDELGDDRVPGDPLAVADVELDELSFNLGVDLVGFGRREHQGSLDSQRSRDQEDSGHEGDGRHREAGRTCFFHFAQPPGRAKKLDNLIDGHPQERHQGAGRQHVADRLQLVRFEDLRQEVNDAEGHDPAVDVAGDRVGHEQEPPRPGQVTLNRDFQPEHFFLDQISEELGALDPEIGYLEPVGHHVVAIVAEQRVGVEEDRVDRADEHGRHRQAVEQAGLAVEPDEGGDAGQEELDVDARRGDPDPVPLVGQQPAIGHVAIEGRRQHQEEHPHLVDLAAEMLGGEPMAELVNNLHDRQANPEAEDGPPVKEALKLRELAIEEGPLADDQGDGREHQPHAGRDEIGGEDPAEVRVHPGQEPFRVDDRDLDEEDVGQEGPDLPPAVLAAAADQHLGLFRAVDQDDAGLVQLGDEPGQVLDRDRLRSILALEGLLDVLEVLLAVELLEQEVLLDLEPEVLEGQWVLDHIMRHPLVELGLNHQISAELHLQVLGGLPEGGHGGQSRGGAHRSAVLGEDSLKWTLPIGARAQRAAGWGILEARSSVR